VLARVLSAAVLGIDAYLVHVETDIANGLPSFATVGLPQGAVKEGRERVAAAIVNSGFDFPLKRITVNLAPADTRKQGSAFDLPIALGVLSAAGHVFPDNGRDPPALADYVVVGELGLEGDVRPVRGSLCIAAGARAAGIRGLIVPEANVAEAGVVDGLEVRGARTLNDVVDFFSGKSELSHQGSTLPFATYRMEGDVSFSDVRGQEHAKRALEVAAAGAHNVLMIGPPGSGKTMLARRLSTILPPFTTGEALQTTKVHSVAGLLGPGASLVTTRPFRSPHHTISDAGLIGGGSNPRPGEVSIAHGGVLFLDELPEFRKNVLEVLRQPLEDGCVNISRAATSVCFPARFMLAAAMNPCPCGYAGDPTHGCVCQPGAIERYMARVSGPLLDRIDLHVEVPAVAHGDLSCERSGQSSTVIRERVTRARARQLARFGSRSGLFANAHMRPRDLRQYCILESSAEQLLRQAIARLNLSARAYHRVIKLARTVADLADSDGIHSEHVSEAIQYRSLDRA